MSLESNLRANIKELRDRGMTPAIMNWSDIIQGKAARLYQQRIQTVDLFPTFLLEDCLLLAQQEFCKEKELGLLDENNCYLE